MALHLRMTGRLFLVEINQAVERHTRFCLLLEDELALRFDDPRAFGRVWLVDNRQEVIKQLGPDAWQSGMTLFYGNWRGITGNSSSFCSISPLWPVSAISMPMRYCSAPDCIRYGSPAA